MRFAIVGLFLAAISLPLAAQVAPPVAPPSPPGNSHPQAGTRIRLRVEFFVDADAPEELIRGQPDDWKEDVQVAISDQVYDEIRELSDRSYSSTRATIRRPSQLPQITLTGVTDSGGSDLSRDELVETIFAALVSSSDAVALSVDTNRIELAALARILADAIRPPAGS